MLIETGVRTRRGWNDDLVVVEATHIVDNPVGELDEENQAARADLDPKVGVVQGVLRARQVEVGGLVKEARIDEQAEGDGEEGRR